MAWHHARMDGPAVLAPLHAFRAALHGCFPRRADLLRVAADFARGGLRERGMAVPTVDLAACAAYLGD